MFGLGLRPKHFADVLEGRSTVSWFEVISENFMGDGGRPYSILEKVRQDYPIALHGVSLSIGSADALNQGYLKRLKRLVDRIQPLVVSDHCCWTGVGGENLHDLMPLPYTEEVCRYLIDRVKRVQDFLGRRILLENVSSYLQFNQSEMTEWEFLNQLVTQADCGLLLDINNVYVNSVNHGFDPVTYLEGIPKNRVGQIHLAGHSTVLSQKFLPRKFLIDTHDHPVCSEVWGLYRRALERFGRVNTMIEWDAKIPEYSVLESEIQKARLIEEDVHGPYPSSPESQKTPARASSLSQRIPVETSREAENLPGNSA